MPNALLKGKRGLVVGIANEHSIAAGCAHVFRAAGAELAVTNAKATSATQLEKSAPEQRFTSTANGEELEIDTHPWGDADLKIDGQGAAHVEGKASAGDAFRAVEIIAEAIEDKKSDADPEAAGS